MRAGFSFSLPDPWRYAILIVTVLVFALLAGSVLMRNAEGVRGKAPASPLPEGLSPEQALAQDLALSDPEVQALTVGQPSEVFGVREVGGQYTQASRACENAPCWQVEIYNFDENATVLAIVDVRSRQVLDVLHQPGVHPGINKRLADLALQIATEHPDVIAALGFQPSEADMAPVESGLADSACEDGHLCVAPTFNYGNWILWAVVDLTERRLAGITWTEVHPVEGRSVPFTPNGCPAPGAVNQDGWNLSYEVTGTDGLRVHDVTYNGQTVITSLKLAEWHVDYGSTGFQDTIGCGGGGGGFPIAPFGDTEVHDLTDGLGMPVGFEVVQDFRMTNWGANCNYRYDQRLQFFADGRFRVVSGAYGRGCGPGTYRPLVRMDLAVQGESGDTFSRWDGAEWRPMSLENYLTPYDEPDHGPHQVTTEGYSWRVDDVTGHGYLMEMDQGQFGDGGRGDEPFLYVTRHDPAEGDTDLGLLGACCRDDHQQGPHLFLDNEPVVQEDLVLWYVSQMVTDDTGPDYYCWTVNGEPNPETYPCFGGPMFHPTFTALSAGFDHSGPAAVGETVVFTNTTTGPEPLSHQWDFGDGQGTAAEVNPTYQYETPGDFQVTLTVSSTTDIDVYSDTVRVGYPAVASFTHNTPISVTQTAVFTSTTEGSLPLSFTWDFGDQNQSVLENPTHQYAAPGYYTVTLSATNFLRQDAYQEALAIQVAPLPAFTYSALTFPNTPIHFADASIGAVSHFWDFGDGVGTSAAPNPTYTFSQRGTYTVTLTTTNPFGQNQTSQEVVIGYPVFLPLTAR